MPLGLSKGGRSWLAPGEVVARTGGGSPRPVCPSLTSTTGPYAGCLVSQPPRLLTTPEPHQGAGGREIPPCPCVSTAPVRVRSHHGVVHGQRGGDKCSWSQKPPVGMATGLQAGTSLLRFLQSSAGTCGSLISIGDEVSGSPLPQCIPKRKWGIQQRGEEGKVDIGIRLVRSRFTIVRPKTFGPFQPRPERPAFDPLCSGTTTQNQSDLAGVFGSDQDRYYRVRETPVSPPDLPESVFHCIVWACRRRMHQYPPKQKCVEPDLCLVRVQERAEHDPSKTSKAPMRALSLPSALCHGAPSFRRRLAQGANYFCKMDR